MEMNQTIIGQFLLFLTTLATFGIQLYRERRNREWDLIDRKGAREFMLQKIEENTVISRDAFTEANNVNQKLLMLSNQINSAFDTRAEDMRRRAEDMKEDLKTIMVSTESKVDDTGKTVDDTHAKVARIEQKLQ